MPETITFHSALAPEAVRDALLRSVSTQGVPPFLQPWFYRLFRNEGHTRPIWGVVESGTFRLRSSSGGTYAPYFYGKWEPGHSGTRIDGYFDLGPRERRSLRFTVAVVLAMAVLGVSLNTLDLTRGTH